MCHEIDELDARAPGLPGRDEGLRADFCAAVGACHERLTAQGVDVARYGPADLAADVDDLRTALGVERWAAIGSYRTSSRTLFEYARLSPDRLASAYLDSPRLPNTDEVTGGLAEFNEALEAFLAGCEAEPGSPGLACPDDQRTWSPSATSVSSEDRT